MTSNVRAVFAQIIGVSLKVGCYLNSYLNRLGEGDFSAQDGIENGFSKIGCYLIGCYLDWVARAYDQKMWTVKSLGWHTLQEMIRSDTNAVQRQRRSVLFRGANARLEFDIHEDAVSAAWDRCMCSHPVR